MTKNLEGTFYRYEFSFRGRQLYARSQRMDTFTGGFWLDVNLDLAEFGDECYWIPPHRTDYIQKEYRRGGITT